MTLKAARIVVKVSVKTSYTSHMGHVRVEF